MSLNAYRNTPTVGVEDGSFQKGITRRAVLTAVLFKGLEIENIKTTKITVDGLDATRKLAKILSEWEFGAILLAGISFAGFNIIDPTIIYEKFGKPPIVISPTKPNNEAVKSALRKHFKDWKKRWEVFEKVGVAYETVTLADTPPIYVETVGADIEWARSVIRALCTCSRIPEPIRVARLIARGLS